jgi:RNA polymerase sigma-70 factor (ECF subfamily)
VSDDAMTACSDESLFAKCCRGDTAAFGVLVRRYERELYGYLRRYLGDASLADDVFQNTFLQLYVKRDQYEAGRPVRPWLYTIATHQAIDALRRINRRPAVSLELASSEDANGEMQSLMDLLEALGIPVGTVKSRLHAALQRLQEAWGAVPAAPGD